MGVDRIFSSGTRLVFFGRSSFSPGSSRRRLLPLEFPPDKVVGIEEEVEGEDEDEVDADFDDESAD
jgi:hypothetical protein